MVNGSKDYIDSETFSLTCDMNYSFRITKNKTFQYTIQAFCNQSWSCYSYIRHRVYLVIMKDNKWTSKGILPIEKVIGW